MRNSFTTFGKLAPVAVFALFCQSVNAETIYKCVKDGKISYGSAPTHQDAQCREETIRDDGPKPAELARIMEEKKLKQEEDRKAQEQALKEWDVRARLMEAEASTRRAKAAEEEVFRLRQMPPPPYPYAPIPYWGPMWQAPPPPAHPHSFGVPDHPVRPPPPQPNFRVGVMRKP